MFLLWSIICVRHTLVKPRQKIFLATADGTWYNGDTIRRKAGMDMNFAELSAQRYSLRKFSDRPVEDALLQQVLEAGRNAPTAHNN